MSRVGFERAVVGNTAGAFMGGMGGQYSPPESFMGTMAYHGSWGTGAILRHATSGTLSGLGHMGGVVGAALSGPFHMVRDGWQARSQAAHRLEFQKRGADRLAKKYSTTTYGPMRKEQADYISQYGREWNREVPQGFKGRVDRLIDGPYKPRKFGVRSGKEHLIQGTKNYAKLMISPTNLGIHLAFAGLMSNDNLLDPKDGFVKSLAESVLGEAGFMTGATIAPAMMAGAIKGMAGAGLITGAAMVAGGFGGALIASQIPSMIGEYSSWGNQNGRHGRPFRSNFVNSEQAATMRQRGMQAIYRSQMNARSALGSEALSYHG